jgi:hypothetical protein
MNIYLLTTGIEYGGEVPRGAYSTIKLAMREANNIRPQDTVEDTVNIYVVELDYDYDGDPPCVWAKHIKTGKIIIGNED